MDQRVAHEIGGSLEAARPGHAHEARLLVHQVRGDEAG